MHFNPFKTETNPKEQTKHSLNIEETVLEKVQETRFLGVIIDDQLSWTPHINDLTKRLKYHIGSINRIKDNIPKHLHKNLYHTLFESHLLYGIAVWGWESYTKLEPLFILQKKCLRILLGDEEAYLEKFRTCVRARPQGSQKLGAEFYSREESKPLFNAHNILTVYNAYIYHITLEVFKVLKYRTPMAIYSLLTRSRRKDTPLITPTLAHSSSFVNNASTLWNLVRQKLKLYDLACIKQSAAKASMKQLMFKLQCEGDKLTWTESEINVTSMLKSNRIPDFVYELIPRWNQYFIV